jgi:prepilin-type N-terminal cleavage/methylation domain-containing protein/prepilin-type processing-associated H-X9-DG protein
MTLKTQTNRQRSNTLHLLPGFTLVELLVVILIIAALAALAVTMNSKMILNADSAKSVANMRQIGSVIGLYAADNSMRLPAAKPNVIDANGNSVPGNVHWHQALLMIVHPQVTDVTLMNLDWYKSNNVFMHNPLFTENYGGGKYGANYQWKAWNPGYAFNLRIASNLGLTSKDVFSQTIAVPLNLIPQPERTPIVAPRGSWHFIYDAAQLSDEAMQGLLVNGKVPILFVDGHVETMPLKEYAARDLFNMPPPQKKAN